MQETALLERAGDLAGRTLAEVAGALGLQPPPDLRRHKGWVGGLVERALQARAGSRPVPDFPELGIELKTLPLDAAGLPTETTFVATLDLADPLALTWERSSARKKLARVLWVPVEADPGIPLPARRLGRPRLWEPSREEAAVLRDDFETIAELIEAGLVDRVDGRVGRWLHLRPKAADSRGLRWSLGEEGWVRTPPRAFYLRRDFTRHLLATWPDPG